MTNTSSIIGIGALSAPLFTIAIGVIVLLFGLGGRRSWLPGLTILGLIAAGVLALVSSQRGDALAVFGGGMISDMRGGLFCLVLALVAALAVGMAPAYLEEKRINEGEFYALILFSTSGAMMMAAANDLVNVFVGLEVLSVSLYILSGFARRERRSEESAVKYFLLGSFASGFLLYGTALIYGAVGLSISGNSGGVGITPSTVASYTNFSTISAALTASASTAAPLAISPLFIAGVSLVIVGLGFKAAIVPFHTYAPDVYEGAPTPVTAFMSVAAKAGAFAAFLRLIEAIIGSSATALPGVTPDARVFAPYHAAVWGLAAATMIVGNVLAVRQTNIKRMLAYSSIAHAGYLLVGVLASASPNASALAQEAVRFYLVAYTFMNVGAFAVVVWLGRNGGEYLDIRDYAGLARRNPLAAAVLSIFLLSLAGIPLTAGFLGKLYLFLSAIQAGEVSLAVLGLVVSAIGVFYYLNLIVQMYFREPEHDFDAPRAGGAKGVALLSALGTIVFGIIPVPVLGPSVAAATSAVTTAPAVAAPASQAAPTVAAPTAEASPSPEASPAIPEVSASPSPSPGDVTPSPEASPAAAAEPNAAALPSAGGNAVSPSPEASAPNANASPAASPSPAPSAVPAAAPGPPASRP